MKSYVHTLTLHAFCETLDAYGISVNKKTAMKILHALKHNHDALQEEHDRLKLNDYLQSLDDTLSDTDFSVLLSYFSEVNA